MGHDGVLLYAFKQAMTLLTIISLQHLNGIRIIPIEVPKHTLRIRITEYRPIQPLTRNPILKHHRQIIFGP